MKFNNGFAPEIRNIAWIRPRMAPIIKAEDADGIFLLSFSILSTLKLLTTDSDLFAPWPESDRTLQIKLARQKMIDQQYLLITIVIH